MTELAQDLKERPVPAASDAAVRRVILAQPRGFCAGVVRAIDIVERALEKYQAPIYVRHEIVHNRHVVNSLKAKGAIFVEELNEAPDGAHVVFSAHGVAKSVFAAAEERRLPVLDATCPLVTKVHNQAKRYVRQGRTIILIGHAGHPEVEGTLGQIDTPTFLVSTEADVAALDIALDAPLAYVTQTTLSVDDTRAVIASLKARFSNIVGPDTTDICYATQHRQTAVRDMCRMADIILVVGATQQLQLQPPARDRHRGGAAELPHRRRLGARSGLGRGQDGDRPHRGRLRSGGADPGSDRSAAQAGPAGGRADGRRRGKHRVPPAGRTPHLISRV